MPKNMESGLIQEKPEQQISPENNNDGGEKTAKERLAELNKRMSKLPPDERAHMVGGELRGSEEGRALWHEVIEVSRTAYREEELENAKNKLEETKKELARKKELVQTEQELKQAREELDNLLQK